MSNTSCASPLARSFALAPRWRRSLSTNHFQQCAVRPAIRPECVSKCPRQSLDPPSMHTGSSYHPAVPPATNLGAELKSP